MKERRGQREIRKRIAARRENKVRKVRGERGV